MNPMPTLWPRADGLGSRTGQGALTKSVLVFVSLMAVFLVAEINRRLGHEISFSLFYLAPVVIVAWHVGLAASGLVSAVAVGLWLLLEKAMDPDHLKGWIPLWNGLVRFGVFMTSAFLSQRLHLLTGNLDAAVKARTSDLEMEIKRRTLAEREVTEASRREQEHLASELHDHLGGYLAGLAFQGKAITERLGRRYPDLISDLKPLVAGINEANRQVRDYAHLISPFGEVDRDLAANLRRLAAHLEKVFEIRCQVEVPDAIPRFTAVACHHLQRIAQEASRNAVRHNGARSIRIRVQRDAGDLLMEITGDSTRLPAPVTCPSGIGMHIMQYRMNDLHGSLDYLPASAERPYSTVTCKVPMDAIMERPIISITPPPPHGENPSPDRRRSSVLP